MYEYLCIVILVVFIYYLWNNNNCKTRVYWMHKPKCPYCIKMKDSWNSVEKHYANSPIVTARAIDTTNKQHISDNFNVNGVPHIVKVLPSGMRYKYNGDRSTSDIIKFIDKDEHDF
jgi:thiol-disulfide isomerase/thioredoxin